MSPQMGTGMSVGSVEVGNRDGGCPEGPAHTGAPEEGPLGRAEVG